MPPFLFEKYNASNYCLQGRTQAMDRRQMARGRASSGTITSISRPLRHPKALTFGGLWIFGLFALFLAPAPSKITPEKLELYQAKLADAQFLVKSLARAERDLIDARVALKEVSVWFWRWRPEHRKEVLNRRPAVEAAQRKVQMLHKERDAILRDAKSALGLWSDAGLEESRELLWSYFQSGKVFAQQQSFFDTIFTLFDSRDKDWFTILIQILFTTIINYTVGTVVAMFSFLVSLPTLLASFAPSWPSAIAFFGVAAIAAGSFLVTYLGLLYAAGAAVVLTTTTFVSQARRIEDPSRPDAPALRNSRSHHD